MDQKCYCLNQKRLIERAKWLEGERLGKDPGPDFVRSWVDKYAAEYRKRYCEEYEALARKVAAVCRCKLEGIAPGVSPELWDVVFKTVIDEFTKIWMLELVEEESEDRKRHLEEI